MAAKPPAASSTGAEVASFLFLLLCLLASKVTSQTTEQQILLQIKRDWGNQTALESWTGSNGSDDHCRWPGIVCAADSSVVNISLSNVGISGPIPSSICDLKNLSHLDLSYNNIPGAFPTVLYGCRQLEYLNISQNLFVGEIPDDVDLLSSRLTVIDLQANNFTGDVPVSFGQFSALRELWLNSNLFNGTFPIELSKLSNLETLTLSYNPFSPMRIPPEFGSLTKLTFLWMKKMNLEGEIPSSFANLTSMVQLDLSINSLTGAIPAGIWAFKNLQYLYLYHNNLTGTINIEGTIGALGLVSLDLSWNELHGPIPEDFGKLRELQNLVMYKNKFSGNIPTSIGRLPSLIDLRMYDNKLTGVLPPDLGKHSPLWGIDFSGNMITGELPKDLCANGQLTSIVVSDNNMNGTIPIIDCATLDNFMIQSNNFTGDLPEGIWATNITTILMNDNALTGSIPDRLPQFLNRLEIHNNQFSGNIPSTGEHLLVFSASNNQFTGKLPTSFTGISKLQILKLGGSRISGGIPEDISLLEFLTELNISHNELSGGIPTSIGSIPVLTTLDLSSNELSGTIPPEIGMLKLNVLNLSSNQLSGEVPSSLQTSAYEESFLSNSNLCASTKSLLGVSPCRHQSGSGSNGLVHGLRITFLVIGPLAFVILVAFMSFVIRDYRRRRDDGDMAEWKLTSFHKLDFTESTILHGLTEENVIGSGGFGKVYKITLGTGTEGVVAVKRIWQRGRKTDAMLEKEFEAEVQILGAIRHMNIVKLLCCISNVNSKLMVYEYLEKGSLDRWLHGMRQERVAAFFPTLYWPTRLKIAIGAARGLCYMHHDCSPPIIHRDVKSSNILLDSEFNARIADFGLARMLFKAGDPDSVSMVTGSLGYLAPECGYSRANEKTDVYSFGVVLLELTTGREASDGGKYSSLAEWAWRHLQDRNQLVDALDSEMNKDPSYIAEMVTVFKTGLMCVDPSPLNRPSMKEVLHTLLSCDRTRGADDKTPQVELDVAPLLQNKLGSRRKMQRNSGEDDQFQSIV